MITLFDNLKDMPLDTIEYLIESFITPVEELGYRASNYRHNETQQYHCLTFEPTGSIWKETFRRLNLIMELGHDDGNDKPHWKIEAGTLFIIIPYEA